MTVVRRPGLLVFAGVILGAVLGPLASVLFRLLNHNYSPTGEWADIDDEADT